MTDLTAADRRQQLVDMYHEVGACRTCPLGSMRTNAVFGMGNSNADLMFVGEAPGAEEDRQGLPFVGRAGKLLDELLGEIGMTRAEHAFIANTLKCRPPGNRDPQPEEIESCRPYLERQIQLIEPRVICTLDFARIPGLLEQEVTPAEPPPLTAPGPVSAPAEPPQLELLG